MSSSIRQGVIECALLGYVLMVVALLTLSPFRFEWPPVWKIAWWGDVGDAPANALLYLPVGYFLRLALPRATTRPVLCALLFGAALGVATETLQLFLPDRLSSLSDACGNAMGSAAGAVLCGAVRRRFERTLPAVLTLEHPLLNLVYLTVPLMWLTGVGVEADPARVWLLAPLGAIGAVTLTGLWRYRFKLAADLPRPALALAVLAWFVFGAVTGLAHAPLVVAQCALGIFTLTLILLYLRRPASNPERRFERKVLAGVWPFFFIYLVLLVWCPLPMPFAPFDFAFGYPEVIFERDFTLRIAEQLGALTLLGYLLAESFGRSFAPARQLFLRNLLRCAMWALLLELAHGLVPGDRASFVRWLLGCASAGFGVLLYATQLSVLRMMLSGRQSAPRS